MFCQKISFECLRHLRGLPKRYIEPSIIDPSLIEKKNVAEKSSMEESLHQSNIKTALTPLTENDLHELNEKQKPKFKLDKICLHDSSIKPKNKYSQLDIPSLDVGKNISRVNPKKLNIKNQHEMLNDAFLPLLKFPYKTQLLMKKHKFLCFLKYIKETLSKSGAPLFQSQEKNDFISTSGYLPSPNIFEYRNKIQLNIHHGVDENPKTLGMFVGDLKNPAMRCVSIENLPSLNKQMKNVAAHFQKFLNQSAFPACYNFKLGGVWRNLILRTTSTGELMAIVNIYPVGLSREEATSVRNEIEEYFCHGDGAECEITSLYIRESAHVSSEDSASYQLIAGKSRIEEKLIDTHFQIGPNSFFPVNSAAAEVLFNAIHQYAAGDAKTTLLDFNCGAGTYSLMMAPDVRSVIGIDNSPYAIADAKANAKLNNLRNCQFIQGTPKSVLKKITNELSESANVVAILQGSASAIGKNFIPSLRTCDSIKTLIYIAPDLDKAKFNILSLGISKHLKVETALVPSEVFGIDMNPHSIQQNGVFIFQRNLNV